MLTASEVRLLLAARKIFETGDLNKGWDGSFKGELCQQGVYVWKLNASSEFSGRRCGNNMRCNRENWDKPIDPDLLRMILCPNAS